MPWGGGGEWKAADTRAPARNTQYLIKAAPLMSADGASRRAARQGTGQGLAMGTVRPGSPAPCSLDSAGRSSRNSCNRGAQGTPITLQSHLDNRHHLGLGAFPGGEALLSPSSVSLFHPSTSGNGKNNQAMGWLRTPQHPSWRLYLLGTDKCCADCRDAKHLQGNENWHRSVLTPATPRSRPQLIQGTTG